MYPVLILAIEGTDLERSPRIDERRRHLTANRSVTKAPLPCNKINTHGLKAKGQCQDCLQMDCVSFLDQNRPTHPDGDKDDQ